MTRRSIIDGEVAQPDPRVSWACPSCRRVDVDELGRRGGLVCAGDPITGVHHSPAAMVRTPPAPTELATSTPADPADRSVAELDALARVRRLAGLDVDRGRAIRVLTFEDLEAMVAADKASPSPGYCATCGPLVEVDNPLRREVRHRRGCPAT